VWLSRIASPPLLGALGLAMVWNSLDTPGAWRWVLLHVAFAIVVPLAYVVWLLRTRQVTDFELYVREQRLRPYAATLAGMTVAFVFLYWGGAPHLLVVLAGASWLQTLLLFGVTRRWKISAHTAAAAGLAVLGISLVGATASPLAAAVPAVAWSRSRLRRHDPAQIVAGVLMGALVWFVALRIGG
jgi:hypothetical protein